MPKRQFYNFYAFFNLFLNPLMKRGRYHQSRQEFNISLDFLNKEHKLLTKREFSCLLNSDYESYKQLFLKNKITSFYGNNHGINWFIDHYINKKEIDYTSKIDAFNNFDLQNISLDNNIDLKMFNYHSKNIIMEIWKTHDIEELTEMLKGIKGFLDINTYYTHDKGKFTYIAIISVDDDTDYEEFSSSIRKLTDVILHIQPFVPNKITYNSSDLSLMQIDKENAYKLIKIYLKRYNINYEIPDASADWYILFLRYVFNHCYYCCKQFTSTIQMIRECGDYHLRSNNYGQRKTFDRKNSLLVSLHDFDFLNQIEANFFFSHTCENQRIICDTCKKDFTSTEFIELHYKKKHFDELIKYDDIVLKNDRWMSFCRNIDTQAIMYVAGMEDWYIPKYAMELNINYTNGNHVSYDMGHIFSGEINLSE